MLSVSSAAPTDRVWRQRPQNGEHAPSGTHAAGSEAGASRGAVADPATSNPVSVGEAEESLEPGPGQPAPRDAVGSMLRGLLRLPEVRGAHGGRVGRV